MYKVMKKTTFVDLGGVRYRYTVVNSNTGKIAYSKYELNLLKK